MAAMTQRRQRPRQGIGKAGNRRLRTVMVELAWLGNVTNRVPRKWLGSAIASAQPAAVFARLRWWLSHAWRRRAGQDGSGQDASPSCRISVLRQPATLPSWHGGFERRTLLGEGAFCLGHDVRLISPQFVMPYVKSNKNDRNDAEAICEAVGRPNMRFVPVKSAEQLAVQAVHRIRSRLVADRGLISSRLAHDMNKGR